MVNNKFRVFDKTKGGKYLEAESWWLNGMGELWSESEGHVSNPIRLSNIVVQPYTGLVDKNDRGLYVGDILKTEYPIGYTIYTVEFDGLEFWLRCNHHIHNGKLVKPNRLAYLGGSDHYGLGEYGSLPFPEDYEYRLIGNVCSNPELLRGKK